MPATAVRLVQVRPERRGPPRLHHHVECDRLVAWHLDFDAMRPRFEIQVLEDPIKIVDDSDVVAIREDVRLSRSLRDPQTAVRPSRNRIVVAARRVSIRVRAAGTVVDADAEPGTIDVWTIRNDSND